MLTTRDQPAVLNRYLNLHNTSQALSSFPFAFNEQSPNLYDTSVKSCILVGFMVAFMFLLVSIRTWIVIRYGGTFRLWSARTFGGISVFICALLGVVYMWLLLAFSVKVVEWERKMRRLGVVGEIEMLRKVPRDIVRARVTARYILIALLWFVKIGFICVFFEFRGILKKSHKAVLYAITVFTIVCILATAIYAPIHHHSVQQKLQNPYGIQGIYADASAEPLVLATPEYINAGMDLLVNILIVIFAAVILHSLKLSDGERIRALIFVLPGLTTVGIALVRCILLLIGSFQKTNQHAHNIWVLSFLTPIEAFMSPYVLCLPAMRLLMRRWKGCGQMVSSVEDIGKWTRSSAEDALPMRVATSLSGSDAEQGGLRASLERHLRSDRSRIGSLHSTIRKSISRKSSIWGRYFDRNGSDEELRSLTWKCSEKDSASVSRHISKTTSMMTVDSQATQTTVVSHKQNAPIDKTLPNLDLGEFFVGEEADRKFEEVIKKEKENYARMRGI